MLDDDFEGACGSVHESSIDADLCPLRFLHDDFLCAVWVYTAVVEYFSTEEQIEPLDELRHLGMIYHGDVEQSVVWHCTWCEPISLSISHTDGHHLSVDDIGVDFDSHFVFQPLENHQQRGGNE